MPDLSPRKTHCRPVAMRSYGTPSNIVRTKRPSRADRNKGYVEEQPESMHQPRSFVLIDQLMQITPGSPEALGITQELCGIMGR